MNIKEQIRNAVKSNKKFAFDSVSQTQSERFKRKVNKFLGAKTYGESERYARLLMNFVLYQHSKNCVIGPVLEALNNFELYEDYNYKHKQRPHFTHQANVFLLGLYLYHEVPNIRNAVDTEMESTTSETEKVVDSCNLRYSGQSKYGEFLYRWRLSSLSHDIGNGISLSGNDEGKIKEYLEEISTSFTTEIERLEDLWYFDDTDLRKQLDDKCSRISSIAKYMDYQSKHPFKGSVYYDHGLVSSLIFLRLMNEEFARHGDDQKSFVGPTKIVWHKPLLLGSILQVAIAISLHNIDQHEKALTLYATNEKIFDLEECPLVWLLKISDILQEWDRPPKVDEKIMTKKITKTNVEISYIGGKVVVKNFPDGQSEKVKQTLEKYTNPSDLIRFV